jgi:hypothetical protein
MLSITLATALVLHIGTNIVLTGTSCHPHWHRPAAAGPKMQRTNKKTIKKKGLRSVRRIFTAGQYRSISASKKQKCGFKERRTLVKLALWPSTCTLAARLGLKPLLKARQD